MIKQHTSYCKSTWGWLQAIINTLNYQKILEIFLKLCPTLNSNPINIKKSYYFRRTHTGDFPKFSHIYIYIFSNIFIMNSWCDPLCKNPTWFHNSVVTIETHLVKSMRHIIISCMFNCFSKQWRKSQIEISSTLIDPLLQVKYISTYTLWPGPALAFLRP